MGRLRGRCQGQNHPKHVLEGLGSTAEESLGHVEPSRASADFTPDGHDQARLLPGTQVDTAEFPGRQAHEALSPVPAAGPWVSQQLPSCEIAPSSVAPTSVLCPRPQCARPHSLISSRPPDYSGAD